MHASPALNAAAPHPDASAPLSNSFTVLVVDDQASVRHSLITELRHAGVTEVMEAVDAPSAVQMFKMRRPDLVLLDIRLPTHDGYWVAQQLREAEVGDWTPIIFLS
ncbi:MAG: response regulator, partial [Comamonas sp.]|nr:response regulator [Comamonas sp.]